MHVTCRISVLISLVILLYVFFGRINTFFSMILYLFVNDHNMQVIVAIGPFLKRESNCGS